MTASKRRATDRVITRQTRPEDIDSVVDLSQRVYGDMAWTRSQLESHLRLFPHGQIVAIDTEDGAVVGNASSIIVQWDNYHFSDSDDDMTGAGWFTNHDPLRGRTLYGADVCVDPTRRRMGIGKKIYAARRELCRSLGLLRIRAGARLRGYHHHAQTMSPEEYTILVINRELQDPTLTFQLRQGFRVLAVVRQHQRGDNESLGHAAIIEWINHQAASRRDFAHRDPRFGLRRKANRPHPRVTLIDHVIDSPEGSSASSSTSTA